MNKSFIATALLTLIMPLASVHATECTETCDSEYKECKEGATSETMKKACEEDVKECKTQCAG